MEQHKEITDLIYKYIRDELNEEETIRLQNWIKQSAQSQAFFEEVKNVPELIAEAIAKAEGKQEIDIDSAWQKMKALGWQLPAMEPPSRVRVIPITWRRYAAIAASLLLIALAGVYVLWLKPVTKTTAPTATVQPVTHDATPHTQHALLTLDDGSTIILDSAQSGSLATQGNTRVLKLANGQISYMGGGGSSVPAKVLYNTVTVPRGSDVVHLQLADGSKVWLNAASSIRYPVGFTGNERRVNINGEAYFEIAKVPSGSPPAGGGGIPFIVSKDQLEVTVLGTHFNVNAYDNEDNMQVTLLEGKVRVKSAVGGQRFEKIIRPGEQAITMNNGQLDIKHDVDLEQVMAWKNGKFVFDNTNIQVIMRQVERWYDLETVYEGEGVKKWEFDGAISRYNNVSRVLKLLEETGSIRFKVEGKKVLVTPQ